MAKKNEVPEGKPDGTRSRRFSENEAKRRYYADHRAKRFRNRFGI
jgi:hypothetical protein